MSESEIAALSAEEIEALQAEVERLRAQNERLEGHASPERKARTRTNWAIVLVLVGALILALTPAAVWLRNIVFDTETWVATVAPLAEDPDIQNAVATSASDALIEQLDAEQRIAELLPDELNLDRFAPVLASSVESAIRTQTTNLVQSDQFAELWAEINRVSHQALLTAITGKQEGALTIESGTFTLDTGVLADKVKETLADRGLGFVTKIPTAAVDKEIVLYQSDTLAMLGPVLDVIQAAAYYIPIIALIFIGAAFALAANKQRVGFWLGIAVTVFGILPLQLIYLGQYPFAAQLESLTAIPSSAAQSAYTIVFRDLVAADQAFIFFGIVILLGALVAGPSRWAVALRSGTSGGLSSAASHLELGSFGTWVGAHKGGLRGAGFVLATLILLAIPGPRSIATLLWLVVLVIVWLIAVEFLGSAGSASAEVVAAIDDEVAEVETEDETVAATEPDAEAEPDTEASADEPEAV